MTHKKYKFGLALSGGGMKGVAHCGVLKRLEELGICPDIISGVSAGSIVAAMYADGAPIKVILDLFRSTSFVKAARFNNPGKYGGISSIKGYRDFLTASFHADDFSQLQIPVIINATDLLEGKIHYFKSGSVVDAVAASACVPGVFNPMEIDGHLYIDGGIFSNLPAEVLREQCDLVIGVHVNPILPLERSQVGGIMGVGERFFHLAINGNTIREKSFCDLVINMDHKLSVSMFDNSKSDAVYKEGYKIACKKLDDFDFSKYGITVNKVS